MSDRIHISQPNPQSKFDQKQDSFLQSFTSHPASVGETYLEHSAFALKFAFRLLCAGCAALIHAFIPAWFAKTGSNQIHKMHAELAQRHNKPNCE